MKTLAEAFAPIVERAESPADTHAAVFAALLTAARMRPDTNNKRNRPWVEYVRRYHRVEV